VIETSNRGEQFFVIMIGGWTSKFKKVLVENRSDLIRAGAAPKVMHSHPIFFHIWTIPPFPHSMVCSKITLMHY
jgi:hypothetical protein